MGGEDWFSIQASGGQRVSFVLTKGPNAQGVNISIHAPNGTELVNDSAFDGVLRAEVETTVKTSGTYYLKVDGVIDESSQIPYTVYTPTGEAPPPKDRRTPTATKETEPNDIDNPPEDPVYKYFPTDKSWVNEIPTDTKIDGKISSPDDFDWYSFYATKGETVSILLTKSPDNSLMFTHRVPGESKFRSSYPWEGTSASGVFVEKGESRAQFSFTANKTGLYYINVSYMDSSGSIYIILANIEQTSKPNTQTGTDSTSTTKVTATESSNKSHNKQIVDTKADNKNSKDNDKNKEGSKSASDSEESPIMMIGIGIIIGGILIGLIVGAVFVIRQ